jgi:pimeloyl-ACP methyl ester carboxylesterase
MPYIYSDAFYEENKEWLKNREKVFCKVLTPEWYEGFRRAIRSAHGLNIVDQLDKITVPTLIVSAEFDATTPVRYQEELHKGIKNSKYVLIKGAGHASMYEKPYEFASIILGFLSVYNKKMEVL